MVPGLVGAPELELSGVRMEQSQNTQEHHQVALSYLKAMWSVFKESLSVKPRLDPFTPGQTILITRGEGRWLSTGTSVSGPISGGLRMSP